MREKDDTGKSDNADEFNNKLYLIAFGARVRTFRKKSKFTQLQFADKCKIEVRHLGRIERGEVNTGITSVRMFAVALNIEPVELMNFKYVKI